MAGAFPIQSLPNGQVRMSDGTTVWPQSTNQGYIDTQRIPNTTITSNNYQVPQTLGLSTDKPSGGGSRWDELNAKDKAGQLSQGEIDELARLRDQQGGGVNDAIGQYRNEISSRYDQAIGNLFPARQEQERYANQLFDTANQGIVQEQQAGLSALGGQRERVATNEKRNLRDLSESMRNSYMSFNNQLGAMGSADSSAAQVMLPYALTRYQTKQQTGIKNTSADQYGDIDQREAVLNNTVLQEKNKLEQERIGQLSSIAQAYEQAKQQLSQLKGQDLQAASQMVLANVINRANQINDAFNSKQSALQEWAISTAQNISQLKSNLTAVTDPALLGKMASYTPMNTQVNYNSSPLALWGGYGEDETRRSV